MKSDVIGMLNGISGKMPSKETLNHPALIEYVTGLDVYSNTREAYLRAYSALGVDIVNRVPDRNAPQPLSPGEVRRNSDYDETYLGVYNSACRHRYAYTDPNELLERDTPPSLIYHNLITPVPHELNLDDIHLREEYLGPAGIYYYQLYTTLFMWGVEVLGWEVFMTAALIDSERFDRLFLEPAFRESVKLIEMLCRTDCPFVFLHDDIADASGPVFPPAWYDEFIFPRYRELFSLVKAARKKVIFVADGNMESFLGTLRELGVDGVMLENPATRLEATLECFGDRLIIGGAETSVLTFGTPLEIDDHIRDLQRRISDVPGFIISCPGGIHGNIPLANLIAYFDARVRIGATPDDWQERSLEDIENRKIRGTSK
jgi:hypothetical protein